MRKLVLFVLVCVASTAAILLSSLPRPAAAQETSALINQALDKPVQLEIDKKLPEAMQDVWKSTGVQFKIDPSVWDLLPWGQDTRLQAKLENITLRDAMRVITRKMGLTLVLRDEYVEIQPMPALRRLGQRASSSELHALDFLSATALGLNDTRPTIKQLLEGVDEKLAADKNAKSPLAVENRMGDAPEMSKQVFVPRNATLMDALEAIPKETRYTWYPWGNNILIVSKEDRTLRLLNKPLTIIGGEKGVDLTQVLADISAQTAVPFVYQPGAIAAVPPDARKLRGTFENAPAQQILDAIVGATGLAYTVQDDKVQIRSGGAAAAQVREPNIGWIQLDNGMNIMVPTSQVPPEIREYLRYKVQKELAKIRQQMEEEGFKPTTQPAGE